MSQPINKYSVFINSRDRLSGIPENFKIQLPSPFTLKAPNSRFEFLCTGVKIPYSFYSLPSGQNTFNCQLINISTGTSNTQTITIQPGNYNILTLINEIILNVFNTFAFTLVITYDRNTGKTYITFNENGYVFRMFFTGTVVGSMIGFENVECLYSIINESDYYVNVNLIERVQIRSSVCLNFDLETLAGGKVVNSDILASINIQTVPGSFIYYDQLYENRCLINKSELNLLDFYLTDERDNIINLNGKEWSFILTIYEYLVPEYDRHTKLSDLISEQ